MLRLITVILATSAFAVSVGVGYWVSYLTGQPRTDEPPAKAPVTPAEPPPVPAEGPNPLPPPEPPKADRPPAVRPEPKPAVPPAPVPGRSSATLTFANDVSATFQARCASCHGLKGKPKGGLDVRSRNGLLKGGDSGPAVVAGQPEYSRLWELVATDEMPPGKVKLTAGEKDRLRRWIEGGAE
jgi:hypothetical protein